MKIVFITAPAAVDRVKVVKAVSEIHGLGGRVVTDSLSYEIRERTHAAFRIVGTDNLPAPAEFFTGQEDIANSLFSGLSPRAAYEKFTKFALDAFGRKAPGTWLSDRVKYYMDLQTKRGVAKPVKVVAIVDDSTREAHMEIVKRFGVDNCIELVVSTIGVRCMPKNLDGVPVVMALFDGSLPASLADALVE